MAVAHALLSGMLTKAFTNLRWLLEDVDSQDRLRAHVDALDDTALSDLRPAHWGPHLPIHQLVMTMAVEHVHHGAEIGLLRDLRRGHARVQPPPTD